MFSATEKLSYLSRMAKEKPPLRFKELYKTVRKPEFLHYAYSKIEKNNGSKTPGVDGITKVKFQDEKVLHETLTELSKQLQEQSYMPLPVRRVEIPKGFGKSGTRPLGIPAIKDRIVQSACKLVLEAIFEEDFSPLSHGFRAGHSCQTAVDDIVWNRYDWVVEGDIKGCFDNIKHGKLLNILRKRIADEKFINLINKFLKSGYQMGYEKDDKLPVFKTESGTPQGGIVSPVLANIYLNEFDKFMESKLKTKQESGRKRGKKYTYWTNKITRIEQTINSNKYPYTTYMEYSDEERANYFETANNKDEVINIMERTSKSKEKVHSKKEAALFQKHKEIIKGCKKLIESEETAYPVEIWTSVTADKRGNILTLLNREDAIKAVKYCRKQRDNETWEDNVDHFANKSVGYTRYADDFVVLLGGYTKSEAKEFKDIISEWFQKSLELTLSEEKTKITHATKGFRFLGYDIVVKVGEKGRYVRPAKLYVPNSAKEKVKLKLENILSSMHNYAPMDLFVAINRVTNGWGNYYKVCHNWSDTQNKIGSWLHWEVAHWLGRKHKSSIPAIMKKYKEKVKKNGHHYKTYVAKVEGKKLPMWNLNCISYEHLSEVALRINKDTPMEVWHKTPIDAYADTIVKINHRGSSFEVKVGLMQKADGKCMDCGKRKRKIHCTPPEAHQKK